MNINEAITISMQAGDSLDWSKALERADRQSSVVWVFDLGLETPYFPVDDEMMFQTLCLGLSQFSQTVWPRFQQKTEGAVLYRGTGDFSSAFCWSEKQKENEALWKEERNYSFSNGLLRRLFCADCFVHYFQMLSHRLPDEMPLYLLLDAAGCGSVAQRHLLFSAQRFEHFEVAVKGLAHFSGLTWDEEGVKKPAKEVASALCFPPERLCSDKTLLHIESAMNSLPPFRVISESFLAHDWDGIEVLYVVDGALSPQGERMLRGFAAAGGRVEKI